MCGIKKGKVFNIGAFKNQEELINNVLENTGVIEEEKTKLYRNLVIRNENLELLEVVKNITSAEDYFGILNYLGRSI